MITGEERIAIPDLGAALDAYQAEAKKTAIYPGAEWDAPFKFAHEPTWIMKHRKAAIAYLALGLAGESGEFHEAKTEAESESEFGDMLWYAAEIARWLQVPLSWITRYEVADFVTAQTVRMGGGRNAVCRLCEAAKKTLRDGESHERNDRITRELMVCIYSAAHHVPPARWPGIMDANLQKLKGRAERGTLKGDGEGR